MKHNRLMIPVRYTADRIIEKLEVPSQENIQYITDRYYWVASKFLGQHFVYSEKISIDDLLTKAFNQMSRNYMKDVYTDKAALNTVIAISLVRVANHNGGKCKVEDDFFISTLSSCVDLKWYHLIQFINQYCNSMVLKMKKLNFIESDIVWMFEKGVEFAETSKNFKYSYVEFIDDIAREIVRLAFAQNKRVAKFQLLPNGIKSLNL
jgi:hypothetical protein